MDNSGDDIPDQVLGAVVETHASSNNDPPYIAGYTFPSPSL